MRIENDRSVVRQLRSLLSEGTTANLSDGQLLERFATGLGESSERAFAALVERHGGLVLRVCRGVLGDSHEAQDAFQATFLVLVRRAGSLWVKDSLGPWLHQVAYRTAACARASAARRQRHERIAAERKPELLKARSNDVGQIVHDELERLPERYRAPIVLCDLEGCSHEQAARHLGWPIGTVKSRQSRGRARLRERLMRRGFSSDGGLLATQVVVPPALIESTLKCISQIAARRVLFGGAAVALSQEVVRAMLLTSCSKIGSAVLVAGAVGLGFQVVQQSRSLAPAARAQAVAQPAEGGGAAVDEVKSRDIAVRVIEGGSLQSSRVEAGVALAPGNRTILSIAPWGSRVNKGAVICELAADDLKEELIRQEFKTRAAKANWQNAKIDREVAEIAVNEYTEGIVTQERTSLKNEIALGESVMERSTARLKRTESARKRVDQAMAKAGATASPADIAAELDIQQKLEDTQQTIERQRVRLGELKDKREILEKFTVAKTSRELRGDVEKKRSVEISKEAVWRAEEANEVKLRQQIESCKFTAPFDGWFVWSGKTNGDYVDKGSLVVHGQRIFSLTDLSSPMLVDTKVHESLVDRLAVGQKATITVDGFPEKTFTGAVRSIAPRPDRIRGAGPPLKVYTTMVEIDNGSAQLRPGMTAKVTIPIDKRLNVLSVPITALLKIDGKFHVAVKKPDGGFESRVVTLGMGNDEYVEIKEGLKAGDTVFRDPFAVVGPPAQRAFTPPGPSQRKLDAAAKSMVK